MAPGRHRLLILVLAAASAVGGVGCSVVPVHKQRLVSKPGMLFSDSAVFSYQSRIGSQIESGAAASGGAQAAGCTSCR